MVVILLYIIALGAIGLNWVAQDKDSIERFAWGVCFFVLIAVGMVTIALTGASS